MCEVYLVEWIQIRRFIYFFFLNSSSFICLDGYGVVDVRMNLFIKTNKKQAKKLQKKRSSNCNTSEYVNKNQISYKHYRGHHTLWHLLVLNLFYKYIMPHCVYSFNWWYNANKIKSHKFTTKLICFIDHELMITFLFNLK